MDSEYQDQLQEQLRVKRRLLHTNEMQIARYGISADPALIIRTEDLRKEVAQLEAQLGIARPSPALPPRRDFVAEQRAEREQARGKDAAHWNTMLSLHRSNLAHYRAQARAHGGIDLAPPITRHGMREAREGIVEAKRNLDSIGAGYDDLPGDE